MTCASFPGRSTRKRKGGQKEGGVPTAGHLGRKASRQDKAGNKGPFPPLSQPPPPPQDSRTASFFGKPAEGSKKKGEEEEEK